MSGSTIGMLPYLFSPLACAPLRSLGSIASQASEFFDVFDPIPSRSTFVFPSIVSDGSSFHYRREHFDVGTATGFLSSLTTIFSSLERVLREKRVQSSALLPFVGSPWKIVDHDLPDGDKGRLNAIMLDGPLGKVMDLRRDGMTGPYRFEFGWARAGVSVFQNLILSQGPSGLQWELGLFIEFQGCALVSLREYLGMSRASLPDLLRWFTKAVSRSGLFEERPLSFSNQPRVTLQGDSKFEKEEITLEVALPPSTAARPLGSLLEDVWNFGEVLVHHQSSPVFGISGVN